MYVDKDLSSKTTNDFLKHSSQDSNLEMVIADIQKQLAQYDFSNDFIGWHGIPLWDNAIEIKGNNEEFTFYVPTKKIYENDIATFFIVGYHHGSFHYELHQRNLRSFHTSGAFGLTRDKCEKLFYYLDYTVLNKKDTIFLRTIKTGRNIHSQIPSLTGKGIEINLISVCFWITHEYECDPLPKPAGFASLTTEYCYWDEQVCIDIDGEGGGGGSGGGGTGGGGGGGGCPWYNPTCSGPPAPVTLNPCQIVDSLVTMHGYSTFLNELRLYANTNHHETSIMMTNPLVEGSLWDSASGPENDLSVNFNVAIPIAGILHNHYNDPTRLTIFSFDDFQKIYEIFNDHKIKDAKSFTFGMVTDSSSYIMFIDSATFKSFADTHLANEQDVALFKSIFYDGFGISPNNTVATNELLFLKAINYFGCGIKLFKGNANMTHFTPIKLNGAFNAVEEDTNCNLLPD